ATPRPTPLVAPVTTASVPSRFMCCDPFLDVAGLLARAKLDDASVGEAARAEGILPDDGFDLPPALAHRHDDSAVARDLAARDEKVACGVVLLQEPDMRRHVGVDLVERGFVDHLDDEHRARASPKQCRLVKRRVPAGALFE